MTRLPGGRFKYEQYFNFYLNASIIHHVVLYDSDVRAYNRTDLGVTAHIVVRGDILSGMIYISKTRRDKFFQTHVNR